MKSSLIIACDGEAASGKSTGAKLISKNSVYDYWLLGKKDIKVLLILVVIVINHHHPL